MNRRLVLCAIVPLLLAGAASQAQTYADTTGHRVLFIGDSITDGDWGKRDGKPSKDRPQWDWNHIFGHGYMEHCATWYMAYHPEAKLQFFNRGISGNRLSDLEARWDEDCLAIRPEVISILIGTNDIHWWLDHDVEHPFGFDAWKARFCALLDRTREALPGVRIVLCTPFVSNSGWVAEKDYAIRNENVCRIAGVIRSICAEYGCVCVEFDTLFESLPGKYPELPLEYWSWDGIHPTPALHRLMSDLWISAVKLF